MAAVRGSDVIVHLGHRAAKRYGTLQRRRWDKEVGSYIFTRAAPALPARAPDGRMYDYAVDQPRIHFPPGLVDTDGQPLGGIHMSGTRQNLIENGDYETDAVGSAAFGGATFARDTTQSFHGAASLKVTTAAGPNSGGYIRKRDGSRMAVTASRLHVCSAWVFATGTAIGKQPCVGIEWWNATPAISRTDFGANTTLVAGWQRLTAIFSAPADAVTAQIFFENQSNQGVVDYWVDLVMFELGAFPSLPIPTGTVAVTSAGEQLDVTPIVVDMSTDWSLYLHFLSEAGNVASWPGTEPQTDPLMLVLSPSAALVDTDNAGGIMLHRQNSATQYEWEYQVNRATAARTFSTTTAAQKLVLRHHASDHHLSAAIDGGAFVNGSAPSTVTITTLQLLRLRNLMFATVFDLLLARGAHTQAELEAY